MRKILVTGGAGFVGRHFVRHFLENGDEVHAVDCVAPMTGGIDPAALQVGRTSLQPVRRPIAELPTEATDDLV